MINPRDFERARDEYKKELQKATSDLLTKKARLKQDQTEIPILQQDVLKHKKEMDADNKKIREDELEIPRLNAEIRKEDLTIAKIQRDLHQTAESSGNILREAGVKNISKINKWSKN
jgi:hypothetical protein